MISCRTCQTELEPDLARCPSCGAIQADLAALALGSLRRTLFAMAALGLVVSAILHETDRSWLFGVHLATEGGAMLLLAALARRAPVTVVAIAAGVFVVPWTALIARTPMAVYELGALFLLGFFGFATVVALRTARRLARLLAAAPAPLARAIAR
jgi:hypothetical protein